MCISLIAGQLPWKLSCKSKKRTEHKSTASSDAYVFCDRISLRDVAFLPSGATTLSH